MRIVKLLLVGAAISAVSVSFAASAAAPSLSFTNSRTYICPGIAPIKVGSMSNSTLNATIAEHLNTMTKMPSEYRCTFKSTGSSAQSSKRISFNSTGFLILKNPSVVGNVKSGFILMADKFIQDSTSISKGTGPRYESSSTSKNHIEISKFNSLKNQQVF